MQVQPQIYDGQSLQLFAPLAVNHNDKGTAFALGILTAFIIMHYQGINANIMSLGGIAIATARWSMPPL